MHSVATGGAIGSSMEVVNRMTWQMTLVHHDLFFRFGMEKMDTNEQKDPLSLDAITERRLVAAFLDFLKTKAQKADTSEAAKESLEGL